MSFWYVFIPALFLAAFLISYRRNRAGLIPGFFFTLFFISFAGLVSVWVIYHSDVLFLKWLLALILLPFALIGIFGIYVLVAFLLLNAKTVLDREKRTLAHSFPLILAAALILFIAATHILQGLSSSGLPEAAQIAARTAESWMVFIFAVYAVHLTHYLIASALCNLSRPRKDQDYIIVLGAGLVDGNVSPLLAKRVDRAADFYKEQKKTAPPPKLIMSGGQGPNEPRPEAFAMAEYAIEKGVPESDIILESKSANTLQNMRFSKEILDDISKGTPYKAIYATSGFHLLRAGIYARKAGMNIGGIGSKTAFYYLPAAMLREYIAYSVIHRKINIAFISLSFIFACAMGFLTLYL